MIKKRDITEQMRSEVIDALINVLGELGNSEHRAPAMELTSYSDEIKQIMNDKVFDAPIRARGVRLVSFTFESVTPDDDSLKKIDRYEYSSNSMMSQGKIIDVMEHAADNPAGAGAGFMGLGMMNMGSGGMNAGVMQNAFGGQQTPQMQYDPYGPRNGGGVPTAAMKCPKCGADVTGRFCSNCGTEMPQPKAPKKCPKCGAEVTGRFCSNCGTEVPDENAPKKCPKCGNDVTGKFCSNCGTEV